MEKTDREQLERVLEFLGPWRALWGLLAWRNRRRAARASLLPYEVEDELSPSSRGDNYIGSSCFIGEAMGGELCMGGWNGHETLLREASRRAPGNGALRGAILHVYNAFEEWKWRRAAKPIIKRFIERELGVS